MNLLDARTPSAIGPALPGRWPPVCLPGRIAVRIALARSSQSLGLSFRTHHTQQRTIFLIENFLVASLVCMKAGVKPSIRL